MSQSQIHIVSDYAKISKQKWQFLLETSKYNCWFQSPHAYEFYASLPTVFEPFVFAVESEQKKILAVVVGYIPKEKNPLKQFFSRRAIIPSGFLFDDSISNEAISVLMKEILNKLKNKVIYIETRNYFDYSTFKDKIVENGFKYVQWLNFQVNTQTEEIIQNNLGKNRKRDVRTSFRDGATVIENPSTEQVYSWYKILKRLYRNKVKTPLFSWSFFEKLISNPLAHYLLVEYDKKIVGGTLCVGGTEKNETLYEWFVCGEEKVAKSVYPSTLATYSGIEFAQKNGFFTFDMMGAGSPFEKYGVRQFKESFGGILVENGRFLYIAKPFLYQLGVKVISWLRK